jgi:lipopolysaccharide exporter
MTTATGASRLSANPHRHMYHHLVTLVSGTIGAQLIVALTTPLVTRFYSPQVFGVGAFFVSVLTLLGPVASLNYFQAILLPRSPADARSLVILSCWSSAAFALLLGVVGFLVHEDLGRALDARELAEYWWLIPFGVFLRSACLFLASWRTRHAAFAVQGRARIIQSLSERTLTLVAGLMGVASVAALVFSRVLSAVLEAVTLLVGSGSTAKAEAQNESPASPAALRRVATEYREFPLYSTASMLLATGGAQLPLILLPILFSPAAAGLFALGYRLLHLPLQLVGESVRTVYYKALTDQVSAGEPTLPGFLSLRKRLATAATFPFAAVVLFGQPMTRYLFGDAWTRAGTFAAILAPFLLVQFVATPLSAVFTAHRRQKILAVISALLFGVSAGALVAGTLAGSVDLALALMSGGGCLVYFVMNFLADRTLGANPVSQFTAYGQALLLSAPLLTMLMLVHRAWPAPEVLIVTAMPATCVYYAVAFRNELGSRWALSRGEGV